MAAVDHDPRGDALALQAFAGDAHAFRIMVRAGMAAAQDQVGVRIALGLHQRRAAQRVDAEVLVRVRRRAHGVAGDADAAVGAVLEADRQVEAADHLAVHLRFAGACANRRPAEQVVEVASHQRLQQFGGDRQPEAEYIQHQPA
ncbi:hypothetical protein D9M71_720080 [compost metagenome]